MNVALTQADKIIGHTAENPAVGCAIISSRQKLVGVGHTSHKGRPHAERVALEMAGDAASGGTAYVTLEPCAHHGATSPCAEALIAANIARIVIGAHDPDRRVAGKGIALLKQAGLDVSVMEQRLASRQMAGFLSRQNKGRPFVFVKMATSFDGFIAARRDAQTWLTGPIARRYVHDVRSRCDVILTSSGTIMADDPALNVRIDGWHLPQPPLAILDSEARLPINAACLAAERPVLLYHKQGAPLKDWPAHVVPIALPSIKGLGLNLSSLLADLHKRALGLVMVEAGARLFASLHEAELIDELIWLRAPHRLESGLLAWQKEEDMDFHSPDTYIMTSTAQLGDDEVFLMHPITQ